MNKEDNIKGKKYFMGFDVNLRNNGVLCKVHKKAIFKSKDTLSRGFRYYENPLEVVRHYAPSKSRYCIVAPRDIIEEELDSECTGGVCSEVYIVREISIITLVGYAENYLLEKIHMTECEYSKINHDVVVNEWCGSHAWAEGDKSICVITGEESGATNTGWWSISAGTGERSEVVTWGNNSVASNAGEASIAINEGGEGISACSAYRSISINSGGWGVAVSTGNESSVISLGNNSLAINAGLYSSAEVTIPNSIAIASGIGGKSRGVLGSWLVLAERNDAGELIDVRSLKVDGIHILPDKWYALFHGEILEL